MSTTTRFSLFTDDELKDALKALETSMISGTRQVTFLGQTVLFQSTSEMRRTITSLTDVLCDRGALDPAKVNTAKRVKRVVIQTDNSGF